MTILLIGSTGNVGQAILYKLLRETKENIALVFHEDEETWLQKIFHSICLDYQKYKERIQIINVSYEKDSITLASKENTYLKKGTTMLINALEVNDPNIDLSNAALKDTHISLLWMEKIQDYKKCKNYLYLSSAFVNSHRSYWDTIPEEIQETHMSRDVLSQILEKKQTTIYEYPNVQLYIKQLSEVLLNESKREKYLTIIRPSQIIPALEQPYTGWNAEHSICHLLTGMGMYIFSQSTHENSVPVDVVAEDFLAIVKNCTEKKALEIRHCCLTSNVKAWFSTDYLEKLQHNRCNYFISNPYILKHKSIFSDTTLQIPKHSKEFMKLLSRFIRHLMKLILFHMKWNKSTESLVHQIKNNIRFTYAFVKNYSHILERKLIFKRESKPNDIKID